MNHEEAGADPMLPIGPLEKPWKDPKKPEDAQAKPPSVNAEYPVEPAPKIEEVVERSVLAFDQSTYFKYQPDLGMTTPLMLLVKTGDSEAIAWFLDELAKRNLVEKALEASTLFGTTPLVIAIQMEVPLPVSELRSDDQEGICVKSESLRSHQQDLTKFPLQN